MPLYKRKNSPYWWISFIDNSGKQHHKSTQTADKKLAEKIFAKVQTLIIEGKWFDFEQGQKHTYDEMIERFFREHAPTKEHGTQRSYKSIRPHLDSFFGGKRLSEIDSDLVSQYVAHRRAEGCRPATRNRELALLSKAFNLARVWKMTKENPCQLVKKEKEDNEIGQLLTSQQETLLLEKCKGYCGDQLSDMVLIALNTGVRSGEVLKLRWDRIDLNSKAFESYNEKTNAWRTCAINSTLYDILLRRSKVRSISGYVFTTSTGTAFERRNVYRFFKQACRDAGIPSFRFHDLRHSVGRRLTAAGKDIYTVAAMLDHSQLSTAKRYARHSVESLRGAAESLVSAPKKEAVAG